MENKTAEKISMYIDKTFVGIVILVTIYILGQFIFGWDLSLKQKSKTKTQLGGRAAWQLVSRAAWKLGGRAAGRPCCRAAGS